MEYANQMLKTEREAKEMLCVGPENCGARESFVTERRLCTATRCLAWRFAKRDGKGFWEMPDGKRFKTHIAPGHGDRGHWVELGYCGVIGDPQTST